MRVAVATVARRWRRHGGEEKVVGWEVVAWAEAVRVGWRRGWW